MKTTYKVIKSQTLASQQNFPYGGVVTYTPTVGEKVKLSDDHTKARFERNDSCWFNITQEYINEFLELYVTEEEKTYLNNMRDSAIIAALQGLVTVEKDSNIIAIRAIGCADALIEKLKEKME